MSGSRATLRRMHRWLPCLVAASVLYASAGHQLDMDMGSNNLEDVAQPCDVDLVQEANLRQLHPILHDLVETTFFRMFRVSLKKSTCPFWRSATAEKEDHSSGTCKGSVPGLGGGGLFGKSAVSSAISPPQDGGSACGVDKELSVPTKSGLGLAAQSSAGTAFPTSGVKAEDGQLDRSMTLAERVAARERENETGSCEFEEDLPTYWVDMCPSFAATELEDVNLIKNAERNTGYNGSHIWDAMYKENCFEVGSALPRGRYGVTEAMCYEERVLYRLLSGWHTSTTISIAKNFYAPGTKKKGEWAPNPERYMEVLGRHPERVKNLHFSFVVLLRAVQRAAPFLRGYRYSTGDSPEDELTKTLITRLLDSQLLSVCSPLFEAFDETKLFRHTSAAQRSQLKRQFKSVFQNVTLLVDCVECQRCRLHAKVFSQGLGAAFKILLSPKDLIASSTSRDEIVALVNVLWKLSESMEDARVLTRLYWEDYPAKADVPPPDPPKSIAPVTPASSPWSASERRSLLDLAVGAVSRAAKAGAIGPTVEKELLQSLVVRPARDEVLVLARYYSEKPELFATLAHEAALASTGEQRPVAAQVVQLGQPGQPADAVIIGGGLAGMAAAMSLLDRGARVVLVEKQAYLGGNSGKASSGINAALETSVESLVADTTRSAGVLARKSLIERLANDSAAAVDWLRQRTGVDLSMRSQLGGHSVQRTLRPANAFVGAELTFAAGQILTKMANTSPDKLRILLKTKWTGLRRPKVSGTPWQVLVTANGTELVLEGHHAVIASGGFGHDAKEAESLLLLHRPDLADFPTTLGPQTTGDGLKIARDVGAQLIDMDRVQLHPTGFVDTAKPEEKTKTLAAELLRGVGGLLLDKQGNRFTDELGTRQAVVNAMLKTAAAGLSLPAPAPPRAFALVLNGKAADMADRHRTLYNNKGLLKKLEGLEAVAAYLGAKPEQLRKTFKAYNNAAKAGKDEFNRTVFPAGHWPIEEKEVFYVGQVVPVIHYTMGGIAIDTEGRVLGQQARSSNQGPQPIPGLYAIGEASGGVHGDNRLAGNSLLECTVFGRLVGVSIPIKTEPAQEPAAALPAKAAEPAPADRPKAERSITRAELQKHKGQSDAWVALYGQVYDLTDYVEEHPGGAQAILDVAGADGTSTFEAVHNKELLASMGFQPVGRLVD